MENEIIVSYSFFLTRYPKASNSTVNIEFQINCIVERPMIFFLALL